MSRGKYTRSSRVWMVFFFQVTLIKSTPLVYFAVNFTPYFLMVTLSTTIMSQDHYKWLIKLNRFKTIPTPLRTKKTVVETN